MNELLHRVLNAYGGLEEPPRVASAVPPISLSYANYVSWPSARCLVDIVII